MAVEAGTLRASIDPPAEAAMREGMEGLIVFMRGREGAGLDGAAAPASGTMRPPYDGDDERPGAMSWNVVRAPLERGAVVGRYVVLQRLGAGAMGVVYAAYDPELDRKVALKLLLHGAGGSNARIRLLREAQALAKISHPNVVAIHDVGTVGDQVWVAMECGFQKIWPLPFRKIWPPLEGRQEWREA